MHTTCRTSPPINFHLQWVSSSSASSSFPEGWLSTYTSGRVTIVPLTSPGLWLHSWACRFLSSGEKYSTYVCM